MKKPKTKKSRPQWKTHLGYSDTILCSSNPTKNKLIYCQKNFLKNFNQFFKIIFWVQSRKMNVNEQVIKCFIFSGTSRTCDRNDTTTKIFIIS